jgi:hypothetical protein
MLELASGVSMMMCPPFGIGVGDAVVVGNEDAEAAADALADALADADALAEALALCSTNTVCWLSLAQAASTPATTAGASSFANPLVMATTV